MIEWLEFELARFPDPAQLAEVGLATLWQIRVEKIGNRKHQHLKGLSLVGEALFEAGDFLFQPPPFGDVGVSFGGLELALSAGLVLVSPLVETVEPRLGFGDTLLSGDCSIEIDVYTTALAARDDLVATALERSGVEHDLKEKHNATPAGKARGTAPLRLRIAQQSAAERHAQPPSGTLSRRAERSAAERSAKAS